MKKFFSEFKEFISRGNVLDLAVGVIIGGAFSTIVTSLTNDIINPLIGLIIGGIDFSSISFGIGDAKIMLGNFITAIINFIIMAFVIFCIVKVVNRLADIRKPQEIEKSSKTKVCPFCKSEIDIEATRCPHCTSKLNE